MLARLMGEWMGTFMCQFWRRTFKPAWSILRRTQKTSSSSKTMTPSTPAKRPRNGSKTMESHLYSAQHSLQTSILLNNSGHMSREGLQTIKPPIWYPRTVGEGRGRVEQD